MNRPTFALIIGILTFTVGVVLAKLSFSHVQPAAPPNNRPSVPLSNYKLSGPYTYENLTIFLIHGEDQLNSKLFLPLQDAMERKVVVMHETSEVNELAIENVSQTEEVFVQAGDVVKGGQQDRMLAVDLIVPSRSGRMPISAFCVEAGRWRQRGEERAAEFSASEAMVASKDLKMAAKHANSQSEVWKGVADVQGMLSRSVGTEVRSARSASSLQLSLENEKVQESAEAYIKQLSPIVEGKSDVIGYVFAISGKVNSSDLYASGDQFKRFWPKLLKTTAIEAVAERPMNEKTETVSADVIRAFFVDAERGQESTKDITKRTRMVKRESQKSLFFETRDLAQNGAWIHRSYLAK